MKIDDIRKNVINELVEHIESALSVDSDYIDCMRTDLIQTVVGLLKEQEPIKPYTDYDGRDVWRCGKCGNSLMHPSYNESDADLKKFIRYCSHCGKAVNWE